MHKLVRAFQPQHLIYITILLIVAVKAPRPGHDTCSRIPILTLHRKCQPDSDTDKGDSYKDDTGPECLENECPPTGVEDVVNSEMVEGAGTQGSVLMRYESALTLAKPIVDDLLPCTSDGGKVTKSVHFANQLSMPDTECRDIPEPHRGISEDDARGVGC